MIRIRSIRKLRLLQRLAEVTRRLNGKAGPKFKAV